MKLRYEVVYQKIDYKKTADLASDSRKYISGDVAFGRGWEDITSKWLVFELGTQAIKVILADDAFDESLNLSLPFGDWLVSAHGVNANGKKIDTVPIKLPVKQSGGVDGDAPLNVPLSESEQILLTAEAANAKAGEALALANDQQNKAATEAAKAEAKANAAAESERNAEAHKTAAETAQTEAERAAEEAGVSETNAADSAEQAALSVLGGGYVGMEIKSDGKLYCTRTRNLESTLNFTLNNGRLEVQING